MEDFSKEGLRGRPRQRRSRQGWGGGGGVSHGPISKARVVRRPGPVRPHPRAPMHALEMCSELAAQRALRIAVEFAAETGSAAGREACGSGAAGHSPSLPAL